MDVKLECLLRLKLLKQKKYIREKERQICRNIVYLGPKHNICELDCRLISNKVLQQYTHTF